VEIVLPTGFTWRRIHGGLPEATSLTELNPAPAVEGSVLDGPGAGLEVTLLIDVDLTMARADRSNRALCASPESWSGWLLWSEDTDAQNIWIPTFSCRTADGRVTPILDWNLPAPPTSAARGPTTITLTVSGYSVNIDREVPNVDYSFRPGVVSDDAGLGLILSTIAGKNLKDSANRARIQDVVWDYTDFGGLTLPNLARLAELR
jgi:hypothetical protein